MFYFFLTPNSREDIVFWIFKKSLHFFREKSNIFLHIWGYVRSDNDVDIECWLGNRCEQGVSFAKMTYEYGIDCGGTSVEFIITDSNYYGPLKYNVKWVSADPPYSHHYCSYIVRSGRFVAGNFNWYIADNQRQRLIVHGNLTNSSSRTGINIFTLRG